MEFLWTVLTALITLGILVAFHEYGHFWVARRCGVKVLRFSVGFGTPLWRTQDADGTEYTISAIPLGGYVRMLDEREGEVASSELHRAFNRQSVWSRIAIVSAGPLANFLLAIFVFWVLFLSGEKGMVPIVDSVEPDSPAYFAGIEVGQEIISVDGKPTPTINALSFRLLERLGDSGFIELEARYAGSEVQYSSNAPIDRWLAGIEAPNPVGGLGIALAFPPVLPVVEETIENSPSELAGFLPGDRIVSADNQIMANWSDWVDYVRARPGVPIAVVVARDRLEVPLSLTPEEKLSNGDTIGSVGMSVQAPEIPAESLRVFDRGPFDALLAALQRTFDLIVFTFESILKMLQGLISTANLSGPITIAQVAASSAESGWQSWLGFLALLSISLGALNLLPIPILDGGHLLFYIIEAFTGRAVPERIQGWGYQMGLIMVMSLMAFALYNDFSRL
ncbi:RIP metalloprotease RseP [Luminiphilus sp. nBUS_07]|uniref:RIP metalloprotease RseP n=1 Tax=Luminiphilus sp. nBUS_07 TaxID=3395314 RepID=UPI003EC035A4